MDLNRLEEALLTEGMRLKTSLVAMETTHNNAGGTVLPLDHMRSVYGMANSRGISVHLDGARMYNAAVALGVTPLDIAQHADTVSLCLSKGLSAPVGAVLAGRPLLAKAARCAACWARAARPASWARPDWRPCRPWAAGWPRITPPARLSEGLNRLHPRLSATVPQTNIVQVETADSGMGNAQWVQALAAEGVLTRPGA